MYLFGNIIQLVTNWLCLVGTFETSSDIQSYREDLQQTNYILARMTGSKSVHPVSICHYIWCFSSASWQMCASLRHPIDAGLT
jgi:hypothetical protein